MIYNYLPIKSVHAGPNSTDDIRGLLQEIHPSRIMLMTNHSVSLTNFYQNFISKLDFPVTEFKEVTQHSPMEEVEHAVELIRNNNCDIIISIGGGSVIDAGKTARYYYKSLEQIAIPTTLSAAEFSHIAGYTIGDEKVGVRNKALTPQYIFLDPRATLETPEDLWRSTGIRALDHSIETIVSNQESEIARTFAIKSIKMLFGNLGLKSEFSRFQCQLAAWYSYFEVYDAPMGLSHNIGKIIGAKWNIPHGITSCITLPSVLRYYALSNPEPLAMIAKELGYEGSNINELGTAFARYVESFISSLGLTHTLTDYEISEKDLDYIISKIKGANDNIRSILTSML